MYDSNNTAGRIKAVAKQRGVSVKQMLTDVGLGFNTLTNMKTSMPKSDNLAKMADYLNCSVDYLLGRTDNPEPLAETVSLHVDDNGVEAAREQIMEIVDQMTPEEQTAYLNVLLSLLSWKSLQPKRQSVGA